MIWPINSDCRLTKKVQNLWYYYSNSILYMVNTKSFLCTDTNQLSVTSKLLIVCWRLRILDLKFLLQVFSNYWLNSGSSFSFSRLDEYEKLIFAGIAVGIFTAPNQYMQATLQNYWWEKLTIRYIVTNHYAKIFVKIWQNLRFCIFPR